jgi:ketosteroid isomerase-like protein
MTEAETTQQFIEALQVLERDSDPTAMLDLFMENSEAGNIVSTREFIGVEGAREFWETYRNSFGEVDSTFRNVIVSNGRAALEWTTTGTSPAGTPIAYEGVSILEMADGRITRFRAYFDAHDLGRQMEEGAEAS